MIVRQRQKGLVLKLRLSLLIGGATISVYTLLHCLQRTDRLSTDSPSSSSLLEVQSLLSDVPVVLAADESTGFIRKTHGLDWEVWNRSSVLNEQWGRRCQWATFKPAFASSADTPAAEMCVHPRERDLFVSAMIMDKGRWADCDGLTPIIQQSSIQDLRYPVHIEIGANIGSCVMQVLLTTNATVYAFEPHPANLFHLTSTLMRLDESQRNRVHLFPVALGAETGVSWIKLNRKNAGNAQMQRNGDVPHRKGQAMIPIERLDDILDRNLHIDQLKMDAQGYECFIVNGMPNTLKNTQNVVFEVEYDQVSRFKECTAASLVNSIQQLGFEVRQMSVEGKNNQVGKHELPDFDNFEGQDSIDLIASRNITKYMQQD